jgi:hypothetical protein
VAHLAITAPSEWLDYLGAGRADLLDAGSIESLELADATAGTAGTGGLDCAIELATADA